MTFDLADGTTREFRIGTRISNPVHQWPAPKTTALQITQQLQPRSLGLSDAVGQGHQILDAIGTHPHDGQQALVVYAFAAQARMPAVGPPVGVASIR